MTGIVLFVVGILAAVLGLGISIALHEVGHLFFAKRFNVRVPQYMIGFGPTLWSFKRGETEYGFKLLPLGGYISMIGMYPPEPGNTAKAAGTGMFSRLIQDGREASAETIMVGEEDRTFYRLPVWKRLLIMFGGPIMNFVLAAIIFSIVAVGFGVYQPTTRVGDVYECVVPAGSETSADECDEPAPGAAAGLLPGDTITALNGSPLSGWDELQSTIRVSADVPLTLTVERGDETLDLTVTPRPNEIYVTDPQTGQVVEDDNGNPITETVGFVGFTAVSARQQQDLTFVGEMYWDNLTSVANVIVTMPERVVQMFQAGFLGAERDPYGPMSVVGVGRITGEVVSMEDTPVLDRVATVLSIVGSLNVMLGVLNLVPLPPLDGGHIAAALWDGLRRWWARLRGKPDPGPFDAAKLLPVTMVMATVLILIGALFIFTDIVNPISLFSSP
ncbi:MULTISPECIES: M50 family metallopeptidase [Gulosibacter]|uniref:M50 family metallopeptidase n=1 Tax=Gulosibacter TaxID=256818 RepID=UPI0019CFB2E9|nr:MULTISPECIES: site-2 protease family protein [Gulosibacter]